MPHTAGGRKPPGNLPRQGVAVNAFSTFVHIVYDLVLANLVKLVGIVMLVTILLQVGARLFLKVPFSWTDELARFSFIWFCFYGSVLTMRHKMHLGIDYFERKMGARGRYVNRVCIYALIMIFGLAMGTLGMQLLELVTIQKTPVMRVSMLYPYSAVPISGFLYAVLGAYFLAEHVTGRAEAAY